MESQIIRLFDDAQSLIRSDKLADKMYGAVILKFLINCCNRIMRISETNGWEYDRIGLEKTAIALTKLIEEI